MSGKDIYYIPKCLNNYMTKCEGHKMTVAERTEFIRDIIENECLTILSGKGKDYGSDADANENFRRVARNLGLTKYQTWSVYFNKHVDAVNNSIKHNPEQPERHQESIRESLKDIINYAGILLSMIEEDKISAVSEERSPSVPLTGKGEDFSLIDKREHKRDQIAEGGSNDK